MTDRRTFTLRVESTTLDKLHYVAKTNKRSVNNQIEILIEELIASFEKDKGEIPLPSQE